MKKLIILIPIVTTLIFANCSNDGDTIYKQGRTLYARHCANCHQENGEGLRGLVPPIAKADYLSTHRADLPCIIRGGLKGVVIVNGVTYGAQEMQAFPNFTEFEVANILNYISTNLGNSEKIWTTEEVREGFKKCTEK
ncbi:MAG: cytochrome c [Saprospiraceae bacterium]|nr:cytochrome c [Saprospiraceae bacterium]